MTRHLKDFLQFLRLNRNASTHTVMRISGRCGISTIPAETITIAAYIP